MLSLVCLVVMFSFQCRAKYHRLVNVTSCWRHLRCMSTSERLLVKITSILLLSNLQNLNVRDSTNYSYLNLEKSNEVETYNLIYEKKNPSRKLGPYRNPRLVEKIEGLWPVCNNEIWREKSLARLFSYLYHILSTQSRLQKLIRSIYYIFI